MMKKYGNLMIIICFVLIVLLLLLPKELLYISEIIILIVLLATFFLGDNKSTVFLSRFKYTFIVNFVIYFFIREPMMSRSCYDLGREDIRVQFAWLLVGITVVFFIYVLQRTDRLIYKAKGEQ